MVETSLYKPENEEINKTKPQEENSYSFSNSETTIKNNYNINKNKNGAKELALKQYKEQQNLKEEKEQPIIQETRESLDKEAMINEAKTMLYEKLGIDDNLNNNSSFENFEKGIIDTLILDNYDLAIQIWETKGKIILDSLKQLASWKGLKQIAKALGDSIWKLLTGNAYEKGKSVGELGLIGTGVGAGVYVGRKGVKLGMKKIARLRVDKERLVNSKKVKQTIKETNNKVSKIVPKKELDFEKVLVEDIAKLGDKDRIEASRFYLKRDITENQQKAILEAHNIGRNKDGVGIYNYSQSEIAEKVKILKEAGFSEKERRILLEKGVCGKEKGVNLKINIEKQIKGLEDLGIPESFSRDMLESGILNKKFFGGDLLKRFKALENNKIYINKKIDEVIKDIPQLTREEALLIFSYTDNTIFRDLNSYMRGKFDKKLNINNINSINNLIKKLESGLRKMPDLEPGKYGYVLRGDKWKGWKKEVGEEIDLEAFTSVANNKNDAFIGDRFDNDIVISILGKEGKIKDVSSLSIGVNYGVTELEKETLTNFSGKLKGLGKTTNEGIILPNSKVVVLERVQLEDIYYTKVKQIK